MKDHKCFKAWIPAYAGMTEASVSSYATASQRRGIYYSRNSLLNKYNLFSRNSCQ